MRRGYSTPRQFALLSSPRPSIVPHSDWPTIPQVYVDGEFIGGCDLLISMHQSGKRDNPGRSYPANLPPPSLPGQPPCQVNLPVRSTSLSGQPPCQVNFPAKSISLPNHPAVQPSTYLAPNLSVKPPSHLAFHFPTQRFACAPAACSSYNCKYCFFPAVSV